MQCCNISTTVPRFFLKLLCLPDAMLPFLLLSSFWVTATNFFGVGMQVVEILPAEF